MVTVLYFPSPGRFTRPDLSPAWLHRQSWSRHPSRGHYCRPPEQFVLEGVVLAPPCATCSAFMTRSMRTRRSRQLTPPQPPIEWAATRYRFSPSLTVDALPRIPQPAAGERSGSRVAPAGNADAQTPSSTGDTPRVILPRTWMPCRDECTGGVLGMGGRRARQLRLPQFNATTAARWRRPFPIWRGTTTRSRSRPPTLWGCGAAAPRTRMKRLL